MIFIWKISTSAAEELGYFSYGGSSLALVFEPGMIQEFLAHEPSSSDWPSCKTVDNCQANQGCLRVRDGIAIANNKQT